VCISYNVNVVSGVIVKAHILRFREFVSSI